MELTDGGWYKTPRIIKGKDFLAHIHDTYTSGNAMYVEFKASEGEVRILEYRQLYDVDTESAVLFTINTYPKESILLKNIEEYEFIQYRPQQAWKAIHMGSTKRLGVNEFNEFRISETFRRLHPVLFLRAGYFWHVMGMEPTDAEMDGEKVWYLYLKRQDKDFMIRVDFTSDQKFIFNPLSDSWSLDNPTQEITDLEQIKKALKSEDVSEVIVSGVPMRLIRVQEIAKGVLFFVFLDTAEKRRYYYARCTTKLRIVENAESGRKEYLLDHVKAMHID
nr:MAG TPA: hypothetical protein [Caudoviricetes sp.]